MKKILLGALLLLSSVMAMADVESDAADFIVSNEGFVSHSYWDVSGWAYGYGTHANEANADGKVHEFDYINEYKARNEVINYMRASYAKLAEVTDVTKLTNGQLIALMDLMYNLGNGAILGSTLLKDINSGDIDGASLEILKWNKVTDDNTGLKVISPALNLRRLKDYNQFTETGKFDAQITYWNKFKNDHNLTDEQMDEAFRYLQETNQNAKGE